MTDRIGPLTVDERELDAMAKSLASDGELEPRIAQGKLVVTQVNGEPYPDMTGWELKIIDDLRRERRALLERLAQADAVAADVGRHEEREACALLAERIARENSTHPGKETISWNVVGMNVARAIRARSMK